MVAAGQFREDLLYRLNSQRIQLPPLRERLEDIQALSLHFLEAERPRRNKTFAEDGLQALRDYDWPGNVRELKRVCEQLSLTAPLPMIRAEDVESWIHPRSQDKGGTAAVDFQKGLGPLLEEYEANIIRACLKKTRDIEEAARLLQVSRSNLYKKIKDYQIEEESSS